MAMIEVNGDPIRDPSSMKIKRSDLSSSDAGRDINGLMHAGKMRDANGNILTKVSISLAWAALSPSEAAAILAAFQSDEYFTVKYCDPTTNTQVTKTFYCGDREIPVKIWTSNNKMYEQVAVNIIER